MADPPITPDDCARNLAAARALIMKGGPGGVVPRDTALMIIDVAEGAGLQVRRLAHKLRVVVGVASKLDERLAEGVRLNSEGQKLTTALMADKKALDEQNIYLRGLLAGSTINVNKVVGLNDTLLAAVAVIKDVTERALGHALLTELGAKDALHEILAVIQGVEGVTK